MPQDEALYRFLTAKLKERSLPVESLPGLLGVSRSTLYRNMKGTVQMTPEVQNIFANLLALNDEERQLFDRLSEQAAFDPTLVEARYALDRFVFSTGAKPIIKPAPIRFAVHDNDIFLRSSSQVFDRIRAAAAADGATTTVHVLNCTCSAPFDVVSSFLEDLLITAPAATVEHLLMLPSTDYAATITIITRLLPLMQFNRYTIRFAQIPVSDPRRADFQSGRPPAPQTNFANSMSIAVQSAHRSTFFFLSFIDDDLSRCLVTSDQCVTDFFDSNYDAVRRGYAEALVDSTDIDLFSDAMADIEETTNLCLLKPDICFSRIPMPVFESMLARMTSDELALLRKVVAGSGGDTNTSVERVMGTLDRRARASYVNRQIDACSMAGFTRFAQTGRLIDHLDAMPSFSIDERRAILTHVQERFNDPHDPYTLYITRDDFLPDGYMVTALEDFGLMIEYNPTDIRRGMVPNLFFRSRLLAEILTDYITNHIPHVHAISTEETNGFLTSLIGSLDNEHYPGITTSTTSHCDTN